MDYLNEGFIDKIKSLLTRGKNAKKTNSSENSMGYILDHYDEIYSKISSKGLVPLTSEDNIYNAAVIDFKQSLWQNNINATYLKQTDKDKNVSVNVFSVVNNNGTTLMNAVACKKKNKTENKVYLYCVLNLVEPEKMFSVIDTIEFEKVVKENCEVEEIIVSEEFIDEFGVMQPINENLMFLLKNMIPIIKNLNVKASKTGDYEKMRPNLLKIVNSCKNLDECYQLKDSKKYEIQYLTELMKTSKFKTEIKNHIKWLNTEHEKALQDKINQLKNKQIKEASVIHNRHLDNIIETLKRIQLHGVTSQRLEELKFNINKFMSDNSCTQIIYTDNRDNLFFGMCVYPNLTDDDTRRILCRKDRDIDKKSYTYVIELDSRLFDPMMGLTPTEITAILLHELGHIIINKNTINEINQMSNMIIAENPDYDFGREFHRNVAFFKYAIYLTIRRMNSIFEKNQEEYIADGIVVEYGYGNELSSAFKKIMKQRKAFVQDTNNKGIALLWAFKVTSAMTKRKIALQYEINQIEKASGSKLEKNMIAKLRDLAKGRGSVYESYTSHPDIIQELHLLRNMQRKGLYALEDDLYEYSLRIKNLESEIEALDLIRTINYKINILKEFISSNGDDYDIERWNDLLEKYLHLREQLMKTQIYRDKYYGLFVEIPKVRGRYQL